MTTEKQAESELPVYDAGALARIVGDNPALHLRLLNKFVASATEQLEQLQAAFDAGDAASVGQIAHSLKSNARAVGALRLGRVCERLEMAGKQADKRAVSEQFADFLPAFSTALEQIESVISSA